MTLDVIVAIGAPGAVFLSSFLYHKFQTFTDLFFFISSFGAALSSLFLRIIAIVITHRTLDYLVPVTSFSF